MNGEDPGTAFTIEPRWRGRLFAFLRVLAFGVLSAGVVIAVTRSLRPLRPWLHSRDLEFLLATASMAVAVIALTMLLSVISRRPGMAYGLGGKSRGRALTTGLALGFGFLCAQLLFMHVLGVYDFGTARPLDLSAIRDAAFYAALFFCVAMLEETAFRGYVLVELSRAITFWPAALVMAALFGLPHALQAGDNTLGGFQAGLFGFAVAISFRYTGSLWLAIGYHAAWDFGESFIFGVPDSGQVSSGRLLHPAMQGPDWLSGGSAGPEGSVLATLPMAALILYVWLRRPARAAAITG